MAKFSIVHAVKSTGHALGYAVWLTGQIIKESVVMAIDTLGTGRNIAPVVIYYPLRVTSERDIAALIASITMTPGTLSLGVTGPKEVDYDAAAGERNSKDAFAVARSEFNTHGLEHVQRFLAVHAMYGADPEELLASLADMEEHLAPSVKEKQLDFDVKYLVEKGRPGPRGFRGSRGGRASDETVFDVEKVDSTPHAAAFVAAILQSDEEEKNPSDVRDMDRKERYEIARRNAERAKARISNATPDIDTFRGDNLGASVHDQEGRTKPGETLYDPLYPKEHPNKQRRNRTKNQKKQKNQQKQANQKKKGK